MLVFFLYEILPFLTIFHFFAEGVLVPVLALAGCIAVTLLVPDLPPAEKV